MIIILNLFFFLTRSFIRTFNATPDQWGPKQNNDDSGKFISYLVAAESTYLTKSQLEASRKVVTRIVRRHKPRAKFKMHPSFLVAQTMKTNGSRMGKGKGSISKYVCKLPLNAVLFEFYRIKKPVLLHLCKKVGMKLTIFLKHQKKIMLKW